MKRYSYLLDKKSIFLYIKGITKPVPLLIYPSTYSSIFKEKVLLYPIKISQIQIPRG